MRACVRVSERTRVKAGLAPPDFGLQMSGKAGRGGRAGKEGGAMAARASISG